MENCRFVCVLKVTMFSNLFYVLIERKILDVVYVSCFFSLCRFFIVICWFFSVLIFCFSSIAICWFFFNLSIYFFIYWVFFQCFIYCFYVNSFIFLNWLCFLKFSNYSFRFQFYSSILFFKLVCYLFFSCNCQFLSTVIFLFDYLFL